MSDDVARLSSPLPLLAAIMKRLPSGVSSKLNYIMKSIPEKPPVVIGGVGGSGTRVVAELVHQLGFLWATT